MFNEDKTKVIEYLQAQLRISKQESSDMLNQVQKQLLPLIELMKDYSCAFNNYKNGVWYKSRKLNVIVTCKKGDIIIRRGLRKLLTAYIGRSGVSLNHIYIQTVDLDIFQDLYQSVFEDYEALLTRRIDDTRREANGFQVLYDQIKAWRG